MGGPVVLPRPVLMAVACAGVPPLPLGTAFARVEPLLWGFPGAGAMIPEPATIALPPPPQLTVALPKPTSAEPAAVGEESSGEVPPEPMGERAGPDRSAAAKPVLPLGTGTGTVAPELSRCTEPLPPFSGDDCTVITFEDGLLFPVEGGAGG